MKLPENCRPEEDSGTRICDSIGDWGLEYNGPDPLSRTVKVLGETDKPRPPEALRFRRSGRAGELGELGESDILRRRGLVVQQP